MLDKPHLVLNWLFDIPNQTLTCKISDELEYIAHQGGTKGYTKKVKNSKGKWKVSKISSIEWHETEKTWISENYGDIVGYFQYDPDRVLIHPDEDRPDPSPNGVGPDGRYLDHMQRLQVLLEGHDMSRIITTASNITFVTPDCGKTIYKRMPTTDVLYPHIEENPDMWWPEHPQPCAMQPYSPGVRLSSYEEMAEEGVDEVLIEICKNSDWDKPLHPELQQWYIYPTK